MPLSKQSLRRKPSTKPELENPISSLEIGFSSSTKLIVIVGPTASGKSAFAVKLAKKINGEIISADSRQVYKGLDLASGKITKKEMAGIKHYCLDIVSPKTTFTAERFKKCFNSAFNKIQSRGKIPILVGGTGFYIDVALGIVDIPQVPPNWELRKKLEKKSTLELLNLLKKLDPKRASTIEPKNKRRLIRAIEIAQKTQDSILPVDNCPELSSGQDILWLGLKIDPGKLKRRINKRLAERLKKGMIQEIKKLHENGVSWRRLDELGLEARWVSQYLRGSITKEEMVQKLKSSIWRYSRRQMTWFKRNKDIRWVSSKQKTKKL